MNLQAEARISCPYCGEMPPIATKRLSVDDQGRVVYRYKRPFRDGSIHVVLEPLDFMARLTALVPRPRLNLTRFHGVFAPNFKHRDKIVPRQARGRVDSANITSIGIVVRWVVDHPKTSIAIEKPRWSTVCPGNCRDKPADFLPTAAW